MNLMVVAIALIVVFVAAVAARLPERRVGREEQTEAVMATAAGVIASSPSATPEPTALKPVSSPLTTALPTVTPRVVEGLSFWYYPGATVNKEGGTAAELSTADASDTVTEWYKTKIKDKNYSVKTFVQTTTNGKVLNKLVGDNGEEEIRVEISREPGGVTIVSLTKG